MKKPKSHFSEIGTRYCTQCQGAMPIKGGEWKISPNGLTRRWICGKHTQNDSIENNNTAIGI